ncbi:MAG: Na-K-Cl cotransporter [Chloroflexi bacterium]|nr:Na-K-Cl cotransporter [Chloroflexota bacterium]
MEQLRDVADEQSKRKFGTFAGVFTPTALTILGAVLYLRTGWVVGNAGLIGGLAIIVIANLITIATGLSIASIATNIRVRAGGAFSIISQSLGLEVGGAISVPFYLAQAISVTFYSFAFAEAWQVIFPTHPTALIVPAMFAVAILVAGVSAQFASRTQVVILIFQMISLVAIGAGGLVIDGSAIANTLNIAPEIVSTDGFTQTPQWIGQFPDGDFWVIFAVFFPAVTGILAGVNMSGDLKDPRKSIPLGTLSAQLLSFAVYVGVAVWAANVATPEELTTNFTIVVDRAFFPPLVLVAILASTFSSALTSLIGAPRVLQAIAQYSILPRGDVLARLSKSGEPTNALLVTGFINILAILFGIISGGLNAIAPLMTMFFLITYTMLNGVVLIEQLMRLISWRPAFKVSTYIPLFGLLGCLFAMFLINPAFSLVALIIIIALYAYLSTRQLSAPWSDVRSGIFVTVAEWAAKQIGLVATGEERAWKPNLLVPVTSTDELLGEYRFLHALSFPRGSVRTLGLYQPDQPDRVNGLDSLMGSFGKDGVFSLSSTLEVEDQHKDLGMVLDVLSSTFFRPNCLYLPVDQNSDEEAIDFLARRANRNQIGVLLFLKHNTVNLGREQVINVFIRERSPEWSIDMRLGNFHLSLLIAYQLTLNWSGQINLITLVADPSEKAAGERFLFKLTELSRLPRGTRNIVEVGDLRSYLSQAPRADLNIFGIQDRVSLDFMSEMRDATQTSCLFIRDSGLESALA